jgi:hypothetical protein
MMKGMARGWESKAVAAQMETAESREGALGEERVSPVEMERIRRKEGLMLSRSRVVHDLEAARNPRYRTMLEEALRHLDSQLSELLSA